MTQEYAGKIANANRPEFELLLACARTRANPHGDGRIAALLRDGIDWENLLRIAHRHGMMPILYSALNTRCPDLVPRAILQRLGDHFRRNAARMSVSVGEGAVISVSRIGPERLRRESFEGAACAR